MREAVTIACQPIMEEGEDKRASRNFNTVQLTEEKYLVWRVISTSGDREISFDVKRKCAVENDPVCFMNIKDGAKVPYQALRNLYISNPRNATGYFMVRIESCEI